MMLINGCMDFAKVTNHGIRLVPNLPLRCMASASEEQNIQFAPPPRDIYSHIIADAQWLQENVLCLLNNAVKYSSHGVITLALFLLSEAAVLAKKGQQRHSYIGNLAARPPPACS